MDMNTESIPNPSMGATALTAVAKKTSLPPYRLASRESHFAPTIVRIGTVEIGGPSFSVIAGPCSVESEDQLMKTAQCVKESGACILRGGAFKPRSSPYSFQGLEEEGLKLLQKARELTEMPIVTEVMDSDDIALVESYADILQVGSRNSQNFSLLKKLGKAKKPFC